MSACVRPFEQQVRDTLARHAMIAPGDRVLAAVSGGADSVALLNVLCRLGHAVEVAHFDHQTRDGASEKDAEFVAGLAAGLGVAFHLESRAVAAEAAAAKRSFEQHAREMRYAFFLRTARARGCAVLATGHHADDQVETVLFRLLRGCGPRAIAGIPPVRVAEGVRIVRPLIACRRDEIRGYLAAIGAQYHEDVSNADRALPRNRIRHELLPLLESGYNARARDAMLRLSERQRDLNVFLDRLEAEALSACLDDTGAIRRAPFAQLDPALRQCVAQRFARDCGVEPDAARILGLAAFISDAPAGHRFDLGGGVTVCNGRRVTEMAPVPGADAPQDVLLHVPGAAVFHGRHFTAWFEEQAPSKDPRDFCSPTRQVFDADRLETPLRIRTRRDGDRFTPLGMTGTRKLSDYFTDCGVPASRRARVPLLLSGDTIVWVTGFAPAAAAMLGPATRRWLVVEISELATEGFHEGE